METLLNQCTVIFRRLFIKKRIFQIEEVKQLFDDIILYLNKLPSDKRKTDGMNILAVIADKLASTINSIRLFDHTILRNHQICLYIKQTFEMLFIKCIHSPSIVMTKQEETCLDSVSYLIVQLCLYQNEPVELFYGKVPKKIFKVTKKPNSRDPTFHLSSIKIPELTDKPNLKTACLPPSAPPARPIEHRKCDITNVSHMKKFIYNFVGMLDEMVSAYPMTRPRVDNLPQRIYRDFFLTQSFFNTLIRVIEDLSQNEYSLCHIKYKIADRFIRLCSQLQIVDVLLNPILKCLQSKNYRHTLESVEIDQIQFYPKQLFFLHECTQFISQHNFLQREQVVNSLCKRFLDMTKIVFDKHFLTTDTDISSNKDGDRRISMCVISSHLEFLYHLSIIPSTKEYFLKSSIVLQLLLILKQDKLRETVEKNKYLFNSDIAIIAYSLLLLCNLAYEKTILLRLKQTNLKEICIDLKFVSDDTIKFASKTLFTILNADDINENHEPMKLREAYIKYIDAITNKLKNYAQTGNYRDFKEIATEIKYIFLTDSFIKKLSQDVEKMSKEEYESNVPKYKETVQGIRICSKQESSKVEVLLNPVIACLKSEYYMKSYENIDVQQKYKSYEDDEEEDRRKLASKQIFYMRECPEFLCQHDYKRQDEIAKSLCPLMLQNAQNIFNQHLPVVFNHAQEMKYARIAALSCHIKLLSHFALTPAVRKDFLSTPIIDNIFLILESETLIDNRNRLIEKYIEIVQECLKLLYNLAFDNDIKHVFKAKNLLSICQKFSFETDEIIQFTSQTLITMLDPEMVEVLTDTRALCRSYINLMNKSSKEPRRPYQGVTLRYLMQNLKIIMTDDTFQETIVNEKDGISSLIKCLFINCSDNPSLETFDKIRRFALNIIWTILRTIYALKVCKRLKSNDQFVEYVLNVANQTEKKTKAIAGHIIWKLGDEQTFRSEHAEKERKRAEHDGGDADDDASSDIDNRLTTDDPLDDFDVFVSFSNNLDDKNIGRKISSRLKAKDFRVYIEKPGKHRLEVMKKAAQQQKTIIICLSNEYRKSKECMAEIEYASKCKCPIVPILADATYKPQSWLSYLIGEKNLIDFTQKNITDAIQKLIGEINKLNEID